MPNSTTTVQEQINHFDIFWNDIRNQVHRELEKRNGQGKPCPTEITGALLPHAQDIICGIATNNGVVIRMHTVETVMETMVEFTEFSYSQTA